MRLTPTAQSTYKKWKAFTVHFSLIVTDQFSCLFYIRQALMPEICVVQRRVMSAAFEQTVVISLLNDRPLFHYDNTIRRLHRGQTMRD